ncbi:unnamed protein product, partial [Allacma fusca]
STSRNREEPTLKTTDKKDSLKKNKSNYKKSVESSQETRAPVSSGVKGSHKPEASGKPNAETMRRLQYAEKRKGMHTK